MGEAMCRVGHPLPLHQPERVPAPPLSLPVATDPKPFRRRMPSLSLPTSGQLGDRGSRHTVAVFK